MKTTFAALLGCLLMGQAFALDSASRVTPEIQAALDVQKRVLAQWATNPVLVNAVKTQNAQGPISGLTNGKWRALKSDDPLVQTLQKNAASQWLVKKLAASDGLFREAFLAAAAGEKVAFVQKPSLYLHTKDPKFTVPMTTGQSWQGKPEWDKSSSSHSVQISVPVLDKGKPIGVLIAGVSMKALSAHSR